MKVVALIAAYNEEQYIGKTLEAVSSVELVDEILVINDGSTDGTQAVVEEYVQLAPGRFGILSLSTNSGKGSALRQGVNAVQGDIYLFLDADLGSTACYARDLLEPVLSSEADMTIARFFEGQSLGGERMGFGLVRRLAALGVRLLTGTRVQSPLSGQRAVKAEVLQRVGGLAQGFGVEVSLTIGALYHGFTLREVPVPMKHRAYGRSIKGFLHRGRQLIHVVKALMYCWRRGWHG